MAVGFRHCNVCLIWGSSLTLFLPKCLSVIWPQSGLSLDPKLKLFVWFGVQAWEMQKYISFVCTRNLKSKWPCCLGYSHIGLGVGNDVKHRNLFLWPACLVFIVLPVFDSRCNFHLRPYRSRRIKNVKHVIKYLISNHSNQIGEIYKNLIKKG